MTDSNSLFNPFPNSEMLGLSNFKAAADDKMDINTNKLCTENIEESDALKRMRAKDDRIVYELNRIVPTQSFAKDVNTTNQCKSLYEQLQTNYGERDNAIKRCINEVSNEVTELREKKMKDPDDDTTHKKLKDKQRQLRLMQKELQVDEVVKDRSLKVFYEKCRNAYLPPNRPDL